MKSKITGFIMSIMTMLMIVIFCFLGYIIYEEYIKEDVVGDVQNFVSNIIISDDNLMENIKTPQILETTINSNENNNEKVDYKNVQINKYYYNQLEEYSRIIYNALESNKDNMKTGTYEINLGTDFSKLLSNENGEQELGKYYQTAIEAFIYDNPDVFYIDYTKLYINIETTTKGLKKTYRVFLNSGNEGNYLAEGFSSKDEIDNEINQINAIKTYFINNKKTSCYDNIKLVHDYLVESIEYDQTISKKNIYNLYGALVNKECVCEGYAKAFKYLMDSVNIPCVIIIGKATNSDGRTENHAWNYVQLDGIWYAIDCTWDDPIIEGTTFLSNSSKYKYFLKGENEFNQSHSPNGQFSQEGKIFKFPELNYSNY